MAGVAIFITFLLGIGNFAMHRAVLESGHPMLARSGWQMGTRLGRLSLSLEFVLLLMAMLLVAGGRTGWGVAYAFYSLLNGLTCWAVLTRRI